MASKTNKIEIVKFDNRFNNLRLTELNGLEIDILCTSLALVADQGTMEIQLSFEEFAEMAGIGCTHPQYIDQLIKDTADKVFNIKLQYLDSRIRYTENLHLFRKMKTDYTSKTVKLLIEEEVVWLVNGLKNNFTAFELKEIVELKHKAAKDLFLHLKQWKSVGAFAMTLQETRELLGIPASCPDKNILSKYVKPAVEEIVNAGKSFTGLGVKAVKTGKSHKLTGFEFRWIPEKAIMQRPGIVQMQQDTVKIKDKPLYTLGEEALLLSEYEKLAAQYGTEIVDSVISRIKVHEYIGKLNVDTISRWCEEQIKDVGECVNATYYPNDDELDVTFKEYLKMRKDINAPLTNTSISKAMEELERLSLGEHETAIKILNKSIANGWKGLFPLNKTSEVANNAANEDIIAKWSEA